MDLGGGGGDNGYLFLGAKKDVGLLIAENGECGIQPGRRGRVKWRYGVDFGGVRGWPCEEAAGWREDVDFMVFAGEYGGELAGGKARCVGQEDLHFG